MEWSLESFQHDQAGLFGEKFLCGQHRLLLQGQMGVPEAKDATPTFAPGDAEEIGRAHV